MKSKKSILLVAEGLIAVALCVSPIFGQGDTGTGQGGGTGASGTTGAYQNRGDRDNNWGWIGLLGLAGLAGLIPRRHHTTEDRAPGHLGTAQR